MVLSELIGAEPDFVGSCGGFRSEIWQDMVKSNDGGGFSHQLTVYGSGTAISELVTEGGSFRKNCDVCLSCMLI